MASKEQRQHKLKICIDNTDPVDEMEEGEVSDSEEEETVVDSRPRKSVFSSRHETVKLELVQQRPLPSPVESDEDVLTVDIDDLETFGVTKKPKPKVYENPSNRGFELGFDPTSEEAAKKRNERAKRFGIPAEETTSLDSQDLQKLYESLKVTGPNIGYDERGIRLEAIHLRGTDHMSTEDVFAYFEAYRPKSVEWIDDSSCNVIWSDKVSAAKAMLKLSEDPSVKESEEESNKDQKQLQNQDESQESSEEKLPSMETGEEEKREPEPQQSAVEEEGVQLFEAEDDDLDLMNSDEEAKPEKEEKESQPQQTQDTKPTSQEAEKMDASDDESDSDQETSHKRDHKPVDKERSPVRTKETKTPSAATTAGNTKLLKRILPPGNWRIGKASDKAKFLFMRFATKADRKMPGAEKRSQYYREYGNPNFGGMKGFISASRKRKLRGVQYRNEQRDAEKFMRKRNYEVEIPEETSFDEHLRLAKRARKLETVSDSEENYGSNRPHRRRRYSEASEEEEIDDDLSSYWAQAEDNNAHTTDGGRKQGEDEMDMERELGELMRKAPAYRYGRMYADDLEEQIKAKRQTAQLMSYDMVDDVIVAANKQHRSTTTTDSRSDRHRKHRSLKHPSEEEEDVQVVIDSRSPRETGRSRLLRRGNDLRSQIERKKEQRKGRYRREEEWRRTQEVEVDIGVEENEDIGFELSPWEEREERFKYEKLRIQVDPDDV